MRLPHDPKCVCNIFENAAKSNAAKTSAEVGPFLPHFYSRYGGETRTLLTKGASDDDEAQEPLPPEGASDDDELAQEQPLRQPPERSQL